MQFAKDGTTGRYSVDTTFPNVNFDPVAVFNPERRVVSGANDILTAGQLALRIEQGEFGSFSGYAVVDKIGDVATAGDPDCAYRVVITRGAIALLYIAGNTSEVVVSEDFAAEKFYESANYDILLPTAKGPSIGRNYMRGSPTSWICHSGLTIETYSANGIPGYGSFKRGSFEADRCVSLFGFKNKGFNFSWVPTNATSARCELLNSFVDRIPDFTLEDNEGLYMSSTSVADQVLLQLQTGQKIDSTNFYIYKCPDSRVDDVPGLMWFSFEPAAGILDKYPSLRPLVHMQENYKELVMHIAAGTYQSWINDPSEGYDAGRTVEMAMVGDIFDSIFTEYLGKYTEYLQAMVGAISDDASGRIREYNGVIATFSWNLAETYPSGYSLINHLQQLSEIHTKDLPTLKKQVTGMFNASNNFITLEENPDAKEGEVPYNFKCYTEEMRSSLNSKVKALTKAHMDALGSMLQYLVDEGEMISFLTNANSFSLTCPKWKQRWHYDHGCSSCSDTYGIWFKDERGEINDSRKFGGLVTNGSKNVWLSSRTEGITIASSGGDYTPFAATRIDKLQFTSVYEKDGQEYGSFYVDIVAHMIGVRLCTYSQSSIDDTVKQVFEQFVHNKYSTARVILLGNTTKVTVLEKQRERIEWNEATESFDNLTMPVSDLNDDAESPYHYSRTNHPGGCSSMRESISHSAANGGGGSNYSWTIPTRLRVYFDDVNLGLVLSQPGNEFMNHASSNADNLSKMASKVVEIANTKSVQWLIDELDRIGVFSASGLHLLGRLTDGLMLSQSSLVRTTNFSIDCDKLIKAFESIKDSTDHTADVLKELNGTDSGSNVSVWQNAADKRACIISIINQLKELKNQLKNQKAWIDPGRVPVVLSKNLALLPTYLNI